MSGDSCTWQEDALHGKKDELSSLLDEGGPGLVGLVHHIQALLLRSAALLSAKCSPLQEKGESCLMKTTPGLWGHICF